MSGELGPQTVGCRAGEASGDGARESGVNAAPVPGSACGQTAEYEQAPAESCRQGPASGTAELQGTSDLPVEENGKPARTESPPDHAPSPAQAPVASAERQSQALEAPAEPSAAPAARPGADAGREDDPAAADSWRSRFWRRLIFRRLVGPPLKSPLAGSGETPGKHSLLESFNWATEGLVWALRHQRNMQIHFGIAIIVIIAALAMSVSRTELLLIFAAITFVIVAEMINTAIEHVVDMITDAHSPVAKIAKDLAAGAVFVAALNALAVAYLVFYDHIVSWPYRLFSHLRISKIDLTVAALVLVGLLVIVFKAIVGRGSAFRGGWPSGHAAVAFGGWVAVTFISTATAYAIPISFVTLLMAILVAQSRVQAGIHSLLEVAAGAMLGILVVGIVFAVWSPL